MTYRALGKDTGMTVGEAFRNAVGRAPHDVAVVDQGQHYSYAELAKRVDRFANALLRYGVRHGDRVVCCMQNRVELVVAFFALQKIGSVYVPINYRLGSDEIKYCAQLTEPKAVILDATVLPVISELATESPGQPVLVVTDDAASDAVPPSAVPIAEFTRDTLSEEPRVDVSPTDTSLVFFTSGTTGRPKGVPRTHGNEIAATFFNLVAFPWRIGERLLSVMPMYHTMGVRLLLSGIMLNGVNVIQRRWDPDLAVSIIEHEEISTVFLVPTMYHDILRCSEFDPGKLRSLRSLGAAGMAIHDDIVTEIRHTLGSLPFINYYGSSEIYTFSFCDYLHRKANSVGRGAPHQRLRIVGVDSHAPVDASEELTEGEIGEIVANAMVPDAFAGYWADDQATARALREGWYFTGDLGYKDEDGDFYVVGRVDDTIISGGENIHPLEVESVLMSCPGVADVAVAGLPDERWGQIVAAFIVRDYESLTEQRVEQHCKNSGDLASFKCPRRVCFVDEIPKSPVGKVLRRVLQDRYQKA